MMTIRNFLLATLLVTQLVLVAIINMPKVTGSSGTINLLTCDPQNVQAITITDDKGVTLTLERGEAGWQINPPDNFPANEERVESMITKLCGLQSKQLVSQTKGSHSRLKVSAENFNRRVVIKDKDNTSHTLYIGTDQGNSGVHVLTLGSDNVYFAKGLSSWEYGTGPRSWWQSLLVNLDENTIKSLELDRQGDKLLFQRSAEGNWSDGDGNTLDQDKAKDLIDTARTITLTDYVSSESEEKLEQVALTLRFTDQDDKTVTIEIGPEREENKDHLARRSDNEQLVVITSANIEPLFSTTSEGLLPVAETTPTPEEPPTIAE
jgi:hypothetical protein